MPYYERPTDTAAYGASPAERQRWAGEYVTDDLLQTPTDTLQQTQIAKEEQIREVLLQSASRPLGALLAGNLVESY